MLGYASTSLSSWVMATDAQFIMTSSINISLLGLARLPRCLGSPCWTNAVILSINHKIGVLSTLSMLPHTVTVDKVYRQNCYDFYITITCTNPPADQKWGVTIFLPWLAVCWIFLLKCYQLNRLACSLPGADIQKMHKLSANWVIIAKVALQTARLSAGWRWVTWSQGLWSWQTWEKIQTCELSLWTILYSASILNSMLQMLSFTPCRNLYILSSLKLVGWHYQSLLMSGSISWYLRMGNLITWLVGIVIIWAKDYVTSIG